VAIDLERTFQRGGKDLIQLLDYSVRSIRTDALFLFLAQEYRMLPTAAKALALYDGFCAQSAPARITVKTAVPPFAVQLERTIAGLRMNRPTFISPKYLFDDVVSKVLATSIDVRRIRRTYRRTRTPIENLKDGKMNQAQRYFVERVWQPRLRPQLVAAGFWRVATVA